MAIAHNPNCPDLDGIRNLLAKKDKDGQNCYTIPGNVLHFSSRTVPVPNADVY
ncbi:MAG: hypothetical protein GF350_05295 [Chitinivibrionales bacterium]|nr:hypothetical protein [Chitinivibrionales bacterium]